tara:strand:- start:5037 stop:5312 length:276 start_codon:yes stop_codon:yes gene_type:complete
MGKYDDVYTFDDFDVLRAIKWCWDRGIYFYPKVIGGQSSSFKVVPKVRIELRMGKVTKLGTEQYTQGDKLYDKIRELYMHKYDQANKNIKT